MELDLEIGPTGGQPESLAQSPPSCHEDARATHQQCLESVNAPRRDLDVGVRQFGMNRLALGKGTSPTGDQRIEVGITLFGGQGIGGDQQKSARGSGLD
jgi:hypothetical protein